MNPDWQENAACRPYPNDWWFRPQPEDGRIDPDLEAARRICEGCPVRLDCLNAALDNREQFGLWGGMDREERRLERRRRARRLRVAA